MQRQPFRAGIALLAQLLHLILGVDQKSNFAHNFQQKVQKNAPSHTFVQTLFFPLPTLPQTTFTDKPESGQRTSLLVPRANRSGARCAYQGPTTALTVTQQRPRCQCSHNSPLTGLHRFQSAHQHLHPCSTDRQDPLLLHRSCFPREKHLAAFQARHLGKKLRMSVTPHDSLWGSGTSRSLLRNACHSPSPLLS